jgi:hypothetical protein
VRVCGLGQKVVRVCGLGQKVVRVCGLGQKVVRVCGLGQKVVRVCGLGQKVMRVCGLGQKVMSACDANRVCRRSFSVWGLGVGVSGVQGYLAHKKKLPPRNLQQHMSRAMWWSQGGGAFS